MLYQLKYAALSGWQFLNINRFLQDTTGQEQRYHRHTVVTRARATILFHTTQKAAVSAINVLSRQVNEKWKNENGKPARKYYKQTNLRIVNKFWLEKKGI